MSARNMAKRTAAGTLALAVCLGGGAIALASAASADANFKFDQRIQGDDRYGTAVAASKAAFDKADNVILVNGYATVDGLTASYLAGVANAPILYVSDKGADDQTKAEIKRLGAKNIWLIGGTTVIPTSVETAIKGDGYNVNRINGSDRYETAKLIAAKGIELNGGKKPSKVFVASGTSFADALAVSPVAFVKGYPIALTDKDSTSQFTKDELGNIGTDAKILVGGEAVVSKKVQADLSIKDEQRVSGKDRAETANYVADWAKKSEGFNPANAALVGGTNGNGADSLVAAPLLGKSFTTLHFAGWDATSVYMKDHAAELTGKGFVFGGKAAVSDGQVSAAQSAAQSAAAMAGYAVKAVGDTTVTVSSGSPSTNKGVVQYTVSGLSSDKVNIALVDPAAITTDSSGKIWFKLTGSTATTASLTAATSGGITVIQGVGNSGTTASGIKPSNGSISFTVDSLTAGSAIPVVFSAADDNTNLTIDKSSVTQLTVSGTTSYYAAAKEMFGLGDKVKWKAAAAVTANYTGLTVDEVDTTAKTIQAYDGGSHYFTFSYGVAGSSYSYLATGTTLSADQFSAIVAKGDTFSVNYNASGPSSYTVTKDIPAAATKIVAAYDDTLNSGQGGVKVTWTPSASADADTYTVTRYAVVDGVVAATGTAVASSQAFTASSANVMKFEDTTVTPGTFVYTVAANNTTTGGSVVGWALSTSGVESDKTDKVVVPKSAIAGSVAGAPTLLSSVMTDNGTSFVVDAGDTWEILFSEPVTGATDNGTSFRINDGSTSATVTIGQNAIAQYKNAGTYTINGKSTKVYANQLLQVQLIAAPTNLSSSTATSVAYPSDITRITSNVKDQDESNVVDLTKGDAQVNSTSNALVAPQAAWATFTPTAPTAVTSAKTDTSGGSSNGTVTASVTGATTGNPSTSFVYSLYLGASTTATATWEGAASSRQFTGLAAGAYTVKVVAKNINGSSTQTAAAPVTVG